MHYNPLLQNYKGLYKRGYTDRPTYEVVIFPIAIMSTLRIKTIEKNSQSQRKVFPIGYGIAIHEECCKTFMSPYITLAQISPALKYF